MASREILVTFRMPWWRLWPALALCFIARLCDSLVDRIIRSGIKIGGRR